MKINKLILFISLCVSFFELSPMDQTSLAEQCQSVIVPTIISNPRDFLKGGGEKLVYRLQRSTPYDLEDKVRTRWFHGLSKGNDSWWAKFMKASVPRPVTIGCENSHLEVDTSHSMIKVEVNTSCDDDVYLETKIYDFNGTRISIDPANCVSDPRPNTLTEDEIRHRLDVFDIKYHKNWPPHLTSGLKCKNNKVIALFDHNHKAMIYDFQPCHQLNEYLEQRAPLAQILVLELLRKAYNQNEEIGLTKEEKEIIDGMPPFVKKCIPFFPKWWGLLS